MSERWESEKVDVAPLGKALDFEFAGRSAQNRFLKGAMTERLSSWDPTNHKARGIPSSNLINVYKRWGEGQYGVILSGNIMFEYDHLEAKGNPIVPVEEAPEGERFEAYKKLATEAKKHGSLIIGQVSHPGRQVSNDIQKNPISASDIQLEGNVMGMEFNKPRAATKEDIKRIIEGFAHTSEYLYKAGFDGVQLHGAHGYLLAQFLSQSTNKRTDDYGGSLENRQRIVMEIAQEVRRRVPKDFVLGIKINSVEFQENGFQPEEAKQLCNALEANKFDFVELSGGTYQSLAFQHKRDSTKKREAFFIEFAENVVTDLKKTKSYVTGGLKSASAMVEALKTVDGVGLARPTTQEFDIPRVILDGKAQSAIKAKIDNENFGLTNVISGTQIRQVGKDHQPLDMSREDQVKVFMDSMGDWSKKFASDTDGYQFGYVDIEGFQPNSYGKAYSESSQL